MAYLTVTDDCLDEAHKECREAVDLPPVALGEFICGGGICVCLCHDNFNERLYQEVRRTALDTRAREKPSSTS